MSGSSKCKSCGRPIVWAKTTHGKNMCVDPGPTVDGNLVLVGSTVDGRIHFDVFSYNPDVHEGRKRYRSHFVSCPNATLHRRR